MVKQNAKKNFIASRSKLDDILTSSITQVADELVRYYEQLLGTDSPSTPPDASVVSHGPLLGDDQNSALVLPTSRDEIRKALFGIDGDKAPGPNKYSSKFFKTTWHITGDHFVAAVSEFFTTSYLLKAWNHAIIALTPKTSHSPTISDFQPISCCSVFYKVVVKILANRLSSVLDGLIDYS